MPSTRSAAKRLRQSIKRRLRNQAARSAMKTAIRRCQRAAQQDIEQAWKLLPAAQRAIDKAARKGAIHPNQAARRKSRLVAYLKRVQRARSEAAGQGTSQATA